MVFVPEMTLCLVDSGKFVSFVREIFIYFNTLREDKGKSQQTPNGWPVLTCS